MLMSTTGSCTLPSGVTPKRSSTWLSDLGLRRASSEAGAESLSGVAIKRGTLAVEGGGGGSFGRGEPQAASSSAVNKNRQDGSGDLMGRHGRPERRHLSTAANKPSNPLESGFCYTVYTYS